MRRRAFIKRASGLLVPLAFPAIVRGQGIPEPILSLLNSPAASTVNNGAAQQWVTRVVANGGATPSNGTITAVNTFDAALVSASIKTKIKHLNFIAPDSLVAARTPYIVGSGLDPWVNVCGANNNPGLTVNGLLMTATTEQNTGFNPSVDYADDNSAGIVLYVFSTAIESPTDTGYENVAATQDFKLVTNASGLVICDCYNQTTDAMAPTLPGGTFTGAGYFGFFRTASNAMAVYIANSGTAHTALSTSATARTGTRSNFQCYLGGSQAIDTPGTCTTVTTKRYSFLAYTLGMTSTESSSFFNAIDALRVSFGGGRV